MLLPIVKLKTLRNSRHPWIYRKMVRMPRGMDLPPGSLVEVRDQNGFVGRAFFHPENTIALRLITEEPAEDVDETFLVKRLAYAKELREGILNLSRFGDSYRLVHAEADALPGLVVDKFADVLLVEPYVAGWLHLADMLAGALREIYPEHKVAVRADAKAAEKEGVSFAEVEKRFPAPAHVEIVEGGVKYRVDFRTGHKTGFFLDQRDNRAMVAGFANGREVLDLCCYTGGFALSALRGGALKVTAVDLDEDALVAARVNACMNKADGGRLAFIHHDVFDVLRDWNKSGRKCDLLVLDPPKLASGKDDVEKALKTYYDLNRAAATVVKPGGLFVTFSCSGAVPEERWRQTVRKAAADAGAGLVIFHVGGPGGDHPVAGDFPQGRYLKALFARVG